MVFSLSTLWWRRIRGLWKFPDGRDWRMGKLGLVLMDKAMLSKSLIQFSVDGWSCVPFLLFTCGQIMVEVMKIMVTSLKRSQYVLLHSVPPTLQQTTTDPCLHQWLPDTHRQVWDSLLWGHCFFLLGPGAQSCCALQESISQLGVSSCSSMVRLMATSSKRAYVIPTSAAPRDPVLVADHHWPIPPQEMLKHSSVSLRGPRSWCTQTFSLNDTN